MKNRKTELQELQDRRDLASTKEERRTAQENVDIHFMGVKKKKKKKKEKKFIVSDGDDDWGY